MDLNDLRSVLRSRGVDVWSLINTAISVAWEDCRGEMRERRDGIVERLFVSISSSRDCNLDLETPTKVSGDGEVKECSSHEGKGASPPTPQWIHNDEEEDDDDDDDDDDDEQNRILDIKLQLEDHHQAEDALVRLLKELDEMDIRFKALKETDIGRHVNLLKRHPSNEVRRIAKLLVSKWKYLVDAWVKDNSLGENAPSTFSADGDSPQQNLPRNIQNGIHQVPDFNYSPSPNTHQGSSCSDKNNSEPEPKRNVIPKREPPTKRSQSPQVSSSPALPNKLKEQKNTNIDAERLASARKRLQDNYQEAQNAKKNRTIQVMDIHDIPKPKNSFFSKNKGGSQGKHW